MQLKRDTDYALRILFCLREKQAEDISRRTAGWTLPEMAATIGAPKLAVSRVCEKLSKAGLIRFCPAPERGGKKCLFPADLAGRSLLEVTRAVEDTGDIFAVFDAGTPMYQHCEGRLKEAQEQVKEALEGISLQRLLK